MGLASSLNWCKDEGKSLETIWLYSLVINWWKKMNLSKSRGIKKKGRQIPKIILVTIKKKKGHIK